jgi:hypothetical protein
MATDNLAVSLSEETEASQHPRNSGPSVVNLIRYVIPTIIVVGVFALLVNHAKDPLSNTDTYFHLRFGQEFLSGNWSLTDPGSVTTFGTAEWVPTQWLPQLVMAQMEDWFGLAGVAWLSGLLYLALALTLWTIARRYASPIAAAPVTAVAIIAASPGMSMRPQVLSYLLIAVTTAAWLQTRQDGKARWWLVPLTWVWAMLHGMWPLGIIIGLVAVVGLALDRAVTRQQWLKLGAIPVLSAIAAALTPVGPRLYSAVLEVSSRGQYFSEWQPPKFTNGNAIALLVLFAIVVIRLARKPSVMSWTETLILLLAGSWAVYSNRTVFVAAVMIVPFAAAAIQTTLGERPRVSRLERATVLGSAAVCLAVLAVLVPRTADEPPGPATYPDWLSTLDELPAGTAVLNDWGEGGYLMWRYPELDFVMNGYGDIFTDNEIARNYQMDATNPGWLDSVKGTGATYALLRPGAKLTYGLDRLEGWTVTERSDTLVLLEAPPGWPDGDK